MFVEIAGPDGEPGMGMECAKASCRGRRAPAPEQSLVAVDAVAEWCYLYGWN